ncbi:LacI family DNA-binding transcriptional regulator [Subdoligranulum variabile]|nr:LacI family DNA-binding transcriptional regulator [Subdoligranulum variabile]UWP67166.1 LacI family DNA-binding transcriptional regulator [Subdoligranulum variabile]
MSVTAKEIARRLHLSPAAVSMALNDRPGISNATRKLVYQTAEQMGYDFSRLSSKAEEHGTIYFICFQASSAILQYSPIFDDILRGAMQECQSQGYRMKVLQFYAQQMDLKQQITDLRISDCRGIILLGTEIEPEIAQLFFSLSVPVVVVDSNLEPLDCTCVLINNIQGAYLATDYLINRRMTQPGYLKSFVPLRNFDERWQGFQNALRSNGMHPAKSIVHELTPTIEGAEADMMEILARKDPLASCYFAENDLIAIGVMRALRRCGYRIPEDIALVGFDNISESALVEPPLTTISIPRVYMGRVAARQLLYLLDDPVPHSLRIEVSTELVKRASV